MRGLSAGRTCSRRRRGLLAACLGAVLVALAATPASGTFPGDSGVIVFTQDPGGFDGRGTLASINPDGSNLTTLDLGTKNAFPSFSPSGQTFLFSCGRAVCSARVDGSNEKKLVSGGRLRWPAYSNSVEGPGGEFITYVKGNGQLIVAEPNGQDPASIPEAGKAWQPDVSVTGEIVFSRDIGKSREIWSIDPDGDDLTRITKGRKGFEDVNPSVAPNGKSVVFERHRIHGSETAHVWRVKANGKAAQRILKNAGTPVFSPTGQQLAFQSLGAGKSTLAVAGKDGANRENVTSGETWDLHPTWQPAEP